MLDLPRRSFIIGLGAALAAPAVARAASLMPIRGEPLYYHRVLCVYDVGSDRILMRIDKARHPLHIPTKGVIPVPSDVADLLVNRYDQAIGDVPKGAQRFLTLPSEEANWDALRGTYLMPQIAA